MRDLRVLRNSEIRVRITRSAECVTKASRETAFRLRWHEVGIAEARCYRRRPLTVRVYGAHKLRVNERSVVTASQVACGTSVEHREGQAGVIEDCAGYLPAVYQRRDPMTPQHRPNRQLDHIVRVDRMPDVIIRRSVRTARIVRVLRCIERIGERERNVRRSAV